MSDKFYLLKDNKGVYTLTLHRPEIHNAFNDEMISQLISVLEDLKKLAMNDQLRILILTGSGASFCAGADLNWMKKMINYSERENFKDSISLAHLFEALNSFPAPVIGKVHGSAFGGGVGLIACCDYVIAVDTAKFGLTEVRLGLLPAVISPFVMAKIGHSNARAYFMSGKGFTADRAMQLGLIHQVCSSEELEDTLLWLIKEFLKAGPKASKMAKELIFKVEKASKINAKEVELYTCSIISKVRTTQEGQEGMTALLDKRRPAWIKTSK